MKSIEVDPEAVVEFTEIWMSFALALNPYINEVQAEELMQEFFTLNPIFDYRGAGLLGQLVRATEDTWASRETH